MIEILYPGKLMRLCAIILLAFTLSAAGVVRADPKGDLFTAACEGWLNVAEKILKTSSANARTDSGETPLHCAARFGHVEMARLLIKRGADVNAKRDDGNMPLHEAVVNGETGVAPLLLAHGARVNAPSVSGEYPLHLAARNGDLALTRLLIIHGARVDAEDANGETPLLYAVEAGKTSEAVYLLDQVARPDVRDREGNKLLHIAALKGDLGMMRAFVSHGCSLDARDGQGLTPLHGAALSGRLDAVRYLLEMGARVDARDREGDTPLHLAARQRHPGNRFADKGEFSEIMRILVLAGADAGALNGSGKRPAGYLDSYLFRVHRYLAWSVFPMTNMIGYPYWGISGAGRESVIDFLIILRGLMFILYLGTIIAGTAVFMLSGRMKKRADWRARSRAAGRFIFWCAVYAYSLNLLFALIAVFSKTLLIR